ncbi:MAG: hypothetical protein JRH14_21390 [Deltaproteobacteria bacterium]|nr:hypothetical protein [Deltaproteobacteria bacterium]
MKREFRFCSKLLAPALLLLLLQAQTCDRGDTYLLSVELEVDGQDLIQNFNVNNRTGYYAVMTTAATATLTVQTRMADSTATYQWIVGGTSIEAGQIGLGGGSVLLNVPPGPSQLYIGVRAVEGNVHGYWVDVLGPIDRNIASVVLAGQQTQPVAGATFDIQFYRNTAYGCGLSGNYTFMVVNPANGDAADQAPLWVYLHGGGVGYYNDLGVYVAVKNQTEDTYNHEETFTDLFDDQVVRHILDNANQPIDSTLKRRIEEGYRVLVVSMCDHDVYSGLGTPYPNNPDPDASVDGLPATMAAIEYTVANYPTTHVFAHGTSAGSIGVWALASSYASEDNPLTGVVADSWIATPRLLTTAPAFSGEPGYPFGSDFDVQGLTDKIGFFANLDIPAYPEAQLADRDFRDVPVLFIAGNNDPFCGGNQAPLAEAVAEGLSNCNWFHDGLRQRIDAQVDSPHELHVLNGFGHVPTNGEGPVNDTDAIAALSDGLADDNINTRVRVAATLFRTLRDVGCLWQIVTTNALS